MSPSPTSLPVVAIPERDIEPMLAVGHHVFLRRGPSDEADREAYERFLRGAERIGVRDGDELVGVAGALPTAITVPGGAALPCSAVTWVGVLPTHRRRGILSAMTGRLLADARAAGRPLLALWASESSIYGRFGYGAAAATTSVELDTSRPLAFRVAPDSRAPRFVPLDRAAAVLAPIYDRARRPGMLTRTARWWEEQTLYSGEPWVGKELSEARVVAIGDAGYAIYRTKAGDDDQGEPGVVDLQELVAGDAATEAALWAFLASIDLTSSVRAWNRPPDDLLPLLLADPDRAKRTTTFTTLWLRVADLPGALEARAWAADVDLTLAIADEQLPDNAGAWRLRVVDGSARCTRAEDGAGPDLSLDTRDLAAAYLGGTRVTRLVAATLATEHTPGAAAALDAALVTPRAPFLADEF